MLRYFAAHPDPREGFIRALSLVLGRQVKSPSQEQLVQVKKMGNFPLLLSLLKVALLTNCELCTRWCEGK